MQRARCTSRRAGLTVQRGPLYVQGRPAQQSMQKALTAFAGYAHAILGGGGGLKTLYVALRYLGGLNSIRCLKIAGGTEYAALRYMGGLISIRCLKIPVGTEYVALRYVNWDPI